LVPGFLAVKYCTVLRWDVSEGWSLSSSDSSLEAADSASDPRDCKGTFAVAASEETAAAGPVGALLLAPAEAAAGALLWAPAETVEDPETEAASGPALALLLAPAEAVADAEAEAAVGPAVVLLLTAAEVGDAASFGAIWTMAGGGAVRLTCTSERPV